MAHLPAPVARPFFRQWVVVAYGAVTREVTSLAARVTRAVANATAERNRVFLVLLHLLLRNHGALAERKHAFLTFLCLGF
jgi:hypothetical protein|tara:strand:+ start:4082 stop:4321 length:240 start_codon:yes stop_codon:yes gene_type:complete